MRGNSEMYVTATVRMLVTVMVTGLLLSSFGGSSDHEDTIGALVLGEPMCLLHGWVNDSVTHEGLSGATVAYLSSQPGNYWYDSTETNETGYYELMANQTEVMVLCTKYGFYPFVEPVNLTGESVYRLDIELENEPTVPVLSATMEPTANISMYNQMELSFAAEDVNLFAVEVLVGRIFNRTGENLNFTVTSIGAIMYNEYEEKWNVYGDLTFYDLVHDDGYIAGKAEWAAWSGEGGYLSNGTSSEYMSAQYERWVNYHPSYGLAGQYYNDTISGEEGFAFFDGVTCEYLGFEFYNLSSTFLEPSPIPDASPDDLEGEFVPLLPMISWSLNESADLIEMASEPATLAPLDRRSVVGLTYELDHTVPSGEYVAVCLALDDVYNINGTTTLITVDTERPVANAGENIEADLGEVVWLNGSATDNVGVVSYVWTFYDGVEFITLEGESVDYVFADWGNHTVTLCVTDGGGNRDYDYLIVSVDPGDFPVAEAGPAERTIAEDTPAQFDGTDSYDEDGEVVGYLWEIVELNLTFTDAEFEFTFSEPGIYEVTLVVEDNAGLLSEPDTMIVTVTDVTAPTADAGEDIDVLTGEEFILNGSDSSDNVGVTEYLWSCEELDDWEGDEATISVVIDIEGTYTFTLETRDAAGNSDTDELVVTVSSENEAPIADAGPDISTTTGETVTFDASGSSDDGEIENYTWTFEYDGETVVLYGETAEFIFELEGEYTVELTVTDDEGRKGSDEVVVTVDAHKAGTNFVPFAAAALIVIAIVILAAIFMRRKKVVGPP